MLISGYLFDRVPASLVSLVWATFGMVSPDDFEGQQQIETVIGKTLLGLWLVASVVVLINMLIAIITTSFQTVQVLYKVCRSGMLIFYSSWMYYLEHIAINEYLSVHPSVCLSIYLSGYLSICLSLCLFDKWCNVHFRTMLTWNSSLYGHLLFMIWKSPQLCHLLSTVSTQ